MDPASTAEVSEPTDEQFREEMRRAVAAFIAADPPKIAGVHHVFGRYSMADASLRIGREGGRQEASMFLAEMRFDRGIEWESVVAPVASRDRKKVGRPKLRK